jgi:hypothetical protein
MVSKMIKHAVSNPGLFLVFGLLVGMLSNRLASGVLGGLICYLIVSGLYHRNSTTQVDE